VSKQATFDRVARHMLQQGARALDNVGGHCVLHATNGLRCAAGSLVKREDYDPDWESAAAVDTGGDSSLCCYLEAKGHDLGLVHDLQFEHDNTEPAYWDKALRLLAKEHKLDPVAIDEYAAARSLQGGQA